MTNTTVERKDVYSEQELQSMLKTADQLSREYFRLRAKALVSLFRTGKRRREIATLEQQDIKIEDEFLYITFTVVKKRKKTRAELATRRRKRFLLSSPSAKHILEYASWMQKNRPNCKHLFPSTHSIFNYALAFSETNHLSGRQILRIIKQLNPDGWCHLFRETRGAEIVRHDEKENKLSIFTVYRVKHALDLEREGTAWNYINRYATETIETEEEILT